MMIIQNSNTNQAVQAAQAAQPIRRVGNDAPKVVTDTTNAKASFGAVEDLPQISVKQVATQQTRTEQLKNAVDDINKVLRQSNNSLEFSVDEDTNKSIVKLVDTETGELIRQIPSDETLAIARSIDRFQQGLLLSQKA